MMSENHEMTFDGLLGELAFAYHNDDADNQDDCIRASEKAVSDRYERDLAAANTALNAALAEVARLEAIIKADCKTCEHNYRTEGLNNPCDECGSSEWTPMAAISDRSHTVLTTTLIPVPCLMAAWPSCRAHAEALRDATTPGSHCLRTRCIGSIPR